jgi:probable rRNA maturation factor
VVISADTAYREAEEAGITFIERVCFLLMHGILHLTGYDHERSGDIEAARMEKMEQEIFGVLLLEGFIG